MRLKHVSGRLELLASTSYYSVSTISLALFLYKLLNPESHGLPVTDSVAADHPKVAELRTLSEWSEGHVWCSPERHGTLTAVFKNQIDWLPLESGGVRPTQGRTLAVMQVCG